MTKDDERRSKTPPEPAEIERPEIYAIKRGAAGALTVGAAGCSEGSTPPPAPDPPPADCGLIPAHKEPVRGLLTIDDRLFSWDEYRAKAWSWTGGALIENMRLNLEPDYMDAPAPFPPLFGLRALRFGGVFSADGKTLADLFPAKAEIWSSKDGQPRSIQTLAASSEALISSACFSADGETMILGEGKGEIELWRVGEKEPLRTFRDTDFVYQSPLAISPDGELLLYAVAPSSLRLMSLSDGKVLNTIECGRKTDTLSVIALTPHSPLAAIGIGRKALILRLPEGDPAGEIAVAGEIFNRAAVSSDGRRLATGASGRIYLWDFQSAEMLGCLYDPDLAAQGTEVSQGRLMGLETLSSPCGTPLPEGATCRCDCVGASRSFETTNAICVCDTVARPAGRGGAITGCVCDTVGVGTKPACGSVGQITAPSGGGHYWRPN
jgi:hypothetical protein